MTGQPPDVDDPTSGEPIALEIRPVAAAEVDQAGEVTLAAYRSLPGGVIGGGYAADLRDVGARTLGATVLVAVENGDVRGSITLVDDPSSPWSESLVTGEVGIRMLGVDLAARGRGIGTALVAACVDRARDLGAVRAVLHSTPAMTAAHRIYDRAGFRRTPERDVMLPDFHLMAFTLELARSPTTGPVEGGVIAEDGTVIGYQMQGQGEALLLVHSTAADARQWIRLVPLLAPTFTVVSMNRRGRGASGPFSHNHSPEIDCGDIASVANSLPGPVHLLGHSSGARLALHAAGCVANLASLILYEPPAPTTVTDEVMRSVARFEASGDRRGLLRSFFVETVGVPEDDFAALEERPIWPLMVDNAMTLPTELRAVRGHRFDPADFAGLTTPTLLLLGELSDADVAGVTHRLADALRNPEVLVLPGQGHGAMFSAPELLASAIMRFVAGLNRGS